MAITENNVKFNQIRSKNIRECRYYWRFLKSEQFELPLEPSTPQDYCSIINQVMHERFDNRGKCYLTIQRMKAACQRDLLTNDELQWIDKSSKRLCYWIWCYIRLACHKKGSNPWGTINRDELWSFPPPSEASTRLPNIWEEPNSGSWGNLNRGELWTNSWNSPSTIANNDQPPTQRPNDPPALNLDNWGQFERPYELLNLKQNPASNSERYELIIDFFDRYNISRDLKEEWLESLKQQWIELRSLERFSWLDPKNSDQAEWAWSYLQNNSHTTIPLWYIPTPLTPKEACFSTITAFDIWDAPTDTKMLFMIKMKKAWSQKKHRDKMDGKKPVSIVMSTESKYKLDKLADKLGKKRNETIEWLIHQEFNKF